jgi:hypothetical protein
VAAESPGWPDGFALLPHPFEVFGWLVGLVPLVFVALVLYLVLGSRRPRVPASTVQAVAAAGFDPTRPPATPVGQWFAEVTPDGSLPLTSGRRGTVRVENGWLGFHEGGAAQPTWIVPANQVQAGKNSMLAQSEVWLVSPPTGRVNLTVSHEHINRFMDNDFKDLRERRYADEFLWVLGQAGAVVVSG